MKNPYDKHFKKIKEEKSDIDKVKEAIKRVKKRRINSLERSLFNYMPLKTITVLSVGFLIAIWGFIRPNDFDFINNHVDLSLFASGMAQEKEKKKDAKNTKTKKIEKSDEKDNANKVSYSDEDMSYFRKLNERKLDLDKREKELEKLEEELQKQKIEIDSRIQDLKNIRAEISNVLKDRVEVDQKKVKKLVEFYSNMKPQQASVLLSKLDEDLAVEILGQMKKKNAANILNLIEPEKAQTLSEKFAGYKFK